MLHQAAVQAVSKNKQHKFKYTLAECKKALPQAFSILN